MCQITQFGFLIDKSFQFKEVYGSILTCFSHFDFNSWILSGFESDEQKKTSLALVIGFFASGSFFVSSRKKSHPKSRPTPTNPQQK